MPLQNPALSNDTVVEWDPRVGFTVPYGPYTMKYKLICKAVSSGQISEYIPFRMSESLPF